MAAKLFLRAEQSAAAAKAPAHGAGPALARRPQGGLESVPGLWVEVRSEPNPTAEETCHIRYAPSDYLPFAPLSIQKDNPYAGFMMEQHSEDLQPRLLELEQSERSAALALKELELARKQRVFSSPFVVAVLVAVIGLLGNATLTAVNSKFDRRAAAERFPI